jgi:SAM-dependent methyltransferase
VFYGSFTAVESHFRRALSDLIDDGAKCFCDVGGGGTPVVRLARIRDSDLKYVVVDISQSQLDRVPAGYPLVLGDILDAQTVSSVLEQHGPFDVAISRWSAEHMRDGRVFHEHVFSLLRPGGVAVHLFPTLYALPFLANRLLLQQWSAAIHHWLFPKAKFKFPAYYSWCRGPTRRQLERIEAIGFSVERYVGFYGHSFYAPIKPLHRAHKRFTAMLVEHPNAGATSFALAVLRRPA